MHDEHRGLTLGPGPHPVPRNRRIARRRGQAEGLPSGGAPDATDPEPPPAPDAHDGQEGGHGRVASGLRIQEKLLRQRQLEVVEWRHQVVTSGG